MNFLGAFLETYLQLNDREEEQFKREVEKLAPKEVEIIMEITTSWHRKGKEEGKKEVAQRLLKKGFTVEDIIEITDLDRETILKLKEVLEKE